LGDVVLGALAGEAKQGTARGTSDTAGYQRLAGAGFEPSRDRPLILPMG